MQEHSLEPHSVPGNVCQVKVLEFWYGANGRRTEVAAKRIWGFRAGSNFIDVYKNKAIIPFLKEDVLKSEKILLHSCKMHLNHPAEAMIYVHVNVF